MAPPETRPAAWLARARVDLRVAEIVLREPKLPSWPAGFHLQQAAEKALKAILVARGRPAPRTHDLQQPVEAVEAAEPGLSGWADPLVELSDFGVSQRSPAPDEPLVDLIAAFASVERLLVAVARFCPEE